MEQLKQRLTNMPNSYFEFVDSILDYAVRKETHFVLVIDYLNNNPLATPSDIIRFISHQPDFFEDSVPTNVGILME